MEEIKKRIASALAGEPYPALELDRVDEEEKIIYMYDRENFKPCVVDAMKIIRAFPEYAAVVFDFNGRNRTVVTRQMSQQEINGYFFHAANWARFAGECDLSNVRANRSTYEKSGEQVAYVIWESPEGIAAGEVYDAKVAESQAILEEIKPIEREMEPTKIAYEDFVGRIEKIRDTANQILTDARRKYHKVIEDQYKLRIPFGDKSEAYCYARTSSECNFSDIRANVDEFSRVTPLLKYVIYESSEGIAAGEELDIKMAEVNAIFEQIKPIEEEMEPVKVAYESYMARIDAIKARANSVLSEAKSEYHKTIDSFYISLIEQEKMKRLQEAQAILASSKFNGNGE